MNTADHNNQTGNGPLLIDVRRTDEYENGHWKGAVNLPLEDLVTMHQKNDPALMEIPAGSRLYCRSGRRSEIARQILLSHGIETINAGGIEN